MPTCNLARELMQIARAGVIAEPVPRLHDSLGSRASKRVDRRKPRQEAREIVQHAADLRLLEHELGDEDGIRVAGLPPWKFAALPLIPS